MTRDEVRLEVDGARHRVAVHIRADGVESSSVGGTILWAREPLFVDHAAEMVGAGPVAPLAGTVSAIHVADGAAVTVGDVLFVIEAMKMEHTIRALAPCRDRAGPGRSR